MSDNGEIQVDLKTRTMNDSQMVAWIKKKIEEEVQCYLNQ